MNPTQSNDPANETGPQPSNLAQESSQQPNFKSEVLTIEKMGNISILWLDSPERRNAMGSHLWRDLPIAINHLEKERDIRAIIVAAKGKSFTVGLDLKDASLFQSAAQHSLEQSPLDKPPSQARQALDRRKEIKRLQDSITSVANCKKPTIAMVHGHCIGGGIDLISACDIRISSADAIFSIRETKMSIVADLGTLQRLPRIIGLGHFNELALTGKDINANRAREIGLVNDVYPDFDSAFAYACELANDIAANSPLVVEGTKQVIRASLESTIDEGLEYVANWNAAALISNDLMEAISAFMEKRPPQFEGN
jgi:enoyl-CoA hydratase